MIKLIIFDMDGTLLDLKQCHYEALNLAIEHVAGLKYTINKEEHFSKYDGLPTSIKLQKLTEEKGLPIESHTEIWKFKQDKTIEVLRKDIKPNQILINIFEELSNKGYTIVVASNSIRKTILTAIARSGLSEYVDRIYSNEDVKRPKPNPEMFLRCMVDFGASPSETLILEDSPKGREAAINSGAFLLPIEKTTDVKLERIKGEIDKIEMNKSKSMVKFKSDKFKVLIPMAGAGSRFQQAGYTFPKPLIEVGDSKKPMIQVVVENLNIDAEFIFIVQEDHCKKYNLEQLLKLITPNCKIVKINGVTEGAACTALLAKEYINTDDHLLIANSDQYVKWDSNDFYYNMIESNVDGGILTFKATHPKWSFAKLGSDGFVTEVAEKNPISDQATVGIYYYNKGSEFVKYTEQMISNNVRTGPNQEFYVCPVYNQYIQDNKKIKIYEIPSESMHGMGIPEDLEIFTNKKIAI